MEERDPAAPAEDVDPELEDCAGALRRYFVQEYRVLEGLVAQMRQTNGVLEMPAIKKAQLVIEKYQEQGQLLEPHLESMVSPLMQIVCKKAVQIEDSLVHDMVAVKKVCIIIHALVTVCGHKTVVKFFPHQAFHLEPAVTLLECCHKERLEASALREESTGQWETKCTLLLWLSILVLVPFDMTSVDTASTDATSNDIPPLVERMITLCKEYLSSPGPMREMAGILLARLLTRQDMHSALLSFMRWTQDTLLSSLSDPSRIFMMLGIWQATAAIFKVGGRDTLLQVAHIAWQNVREVSKATMATGNSLLRKFIVKVIQRLGLVYMPPRVVNWQYTGVTSSLGQNLANVVSSESKARVQHSNGQFSHKESDDEDFEVPEILEEIIEHLLTGLKDKDTIVRWSAAKGIGRVTGRLNSSFADDVVSSVLELFSPAHGDGAWHGGCLALAELARRGLLIPARLPNVIPVIVQALHYDVRRGPHSVGLHVRDAAAYVCWAFARAYSPALMHEHLKQLTPTLLSIACYDREVNCRRAASAAFQENVGRQGDFPHGIDLVNTADYFALATRSNAYRNVAVYVAQFEEYRAALIEELLHSKIRHWEKGLRELAAEALALLVKYDTDYFGGSVLDMLLPWSQSTDLNLRHGATLAIAEVILALFNSGYKYPPEKEKSLANVVPAIEKARLYRGKGGEIMRAAVSRLIECQALTKLPLSEKIKVQLLNTLNENLKHPNGQIQDRAVAALKAFVRSYLVPVNRENIELVTLKHLKILQIDSNPAARRGSALAFTALPIEFLLPVWEDVFDTLCKTATLEMNLEERDAETRVNSVLGITTICKNFSDAGKEFLALQRGNKCVVTSIKDQVMACLFNALNDYAVDNRGDVGSWVREAAMEGIEQCTYIFSKLVARDDTFLSKDEETTAENKTISNEAAIDTSSQSVHEFILDVKLASEIVGGLVKQALEKIDRVREVAGKALQRIVHNKRVLIPFIPHKLELEMLVPADKNFNWGVPANTFPRLVPLLKFLEYRPFVVSGLVISIGGLGESLLKVALNALMDFLEADATNFMKHSGQTNWLGVELVLILRRYAGVDRVVIPALKTINALFSKGVFRSLQRLEETHALDILASVKAEVKGSKDITKIIVAINVLSHIALMDEPLASGALSQLFSLLGHRYPKVRKTCADQVYLLLMQKGEELLSDESLNLAVELIGESCWDGPLEHSRSDRLKLLNLFKTPEHRLSMEDSDHSNIESSLKHVIRDENASYAALVNDLKY